MPWHSACNTLSDNNDDDVVMIIIFETSRTSILLEIIFINLIFEGKLDLEKYDLSEKKNINRN